MADLGSVADTPGAFALNIMPAYRPFPVWLYAGSWLAFSLFAGVDISGALSGMVKREGVAIANARVFLYYRNTGALIGSVRSAADGTFAFSPTVLPYIGLDKTRSDYFILVKDPELEYNAVIYDLLTPV